MLSKYRILVFVFLSLSFRICIAQSQVKIIGQFIGVKAAQIPTVSVKAAFIKNEGTAMPVSDLGFFSGTIEADQSGIATLSFQNYSYSFVIAHEPVLRFRIESTDSNKMDIHIEDSKENDAYLYAKILMRDQYRMYSYFTQYDNDSCLHMMQIEQSAYRHHRDSLTKLYPGTYAADVLCRFYNIEHPDHSLGLPSFIKHQFLEQTPWDLPGIWNNRSINNIISLYLNYAPETGIALQRSLISLLSKTKYGSEDRERMAAMLFDVFETDETDDRLKQFLILANDIPPLFSNPALAAKCKLLQKTLAGEQAPEISLPDSNDQKISLIHTANENQYTLLLIWNPDCEHCIEALSALNKVYGQYHSKGLQIYAVSMGLERNAWLKAIQHSGASWINVQALPETVSQPEQYMINYTPRLVLINKQGRIVKRQLPVEELPRIMNALF